MSVLNTEVVPELPGKIETLMDEVKKMTVGVDATSEIAKSTEAPQFIKDADLLSDVIGKFQDMAKKVIGSEGDTLGNEGTVYAAYEAGKKAIEAMGGEL